MKKLLKDKRVILFVASLALIALVVLGSALKDVSFRPVQPLSQSDSATIQISVGDMIERISDVPLWKQVTFWVLVFFFVLLVASLLSPELRKRLLLGILRIALSVLLLLYVMKKNPGFLSGLFSMKLPSAEPGSSSVTENIPPPVFETPHISNWLSFLITLGIVLLAAFVIWRVNRWLARRSELLALGRPLDEIADIARTSLQDLSSGNASSHDAIIQCYERMSHAVGSKRGLNRDYAMTPSEFAARLEKAGLPHEPVSRLTRLFESVRYGARTSEPRDVDEAVSCLTAILKYCGEAA